MAVRSVLYVPGSNHRVMEKARLLDADVLIFDLEDAVAPDAKIDARRAVCKLLNEPRSGRQRYVTRINDLDTPWGLDDLLAVTRVRPDAILLPKVETDELIEYVEARLVVEELCQEIGIWAMLETPLGLLRADQVLRAAAARSSRLSTLVMGLNDLANLTGTRQVPGRAPMAPLLANAVLVAKAYGMAIVDGVYNALDDAAGLLDECRQARDFGFDGKSLIHPSQIEAANLVFSPGEEEVARARAVVQAYAAPESRHLGAIRLNGQMVERLHLQQAERTLAMSAAIHASHGSAV